MIRVKAQSQYDAGGAPVRDPGSTGMNRGSTRMNRGKPGLHWDSIKIFNTSGMNRESPEGLETTGAAPRTNGTAPGTTGTAP
ncbi:hypothetical protein DPMN_164627 [Dreissena polymorpha]|uniref:Uncharacterized protein n=1 Tax=Dreissena polymorpha TaxID=45954 RepID=A0A9D4ETZ7_DREPO|nr:hypothetical protein DPMN_164627 [Dreissena polymorpha]